MAHKKCAITKKSVPSCEKCAILPVQSGYLDYRKKSPILGSVRNFKLGVEMSKSDAKSKEKDTRSRCWFLTLNNPQHNQQECTNFDQTKQETQEKIVDVLMSLWSDDPDDVSRGVGCCLEQGDNGTIHAHIVLCSTNGVRFSTVKRLYPKARIEKGRGSTKAIKNYLEKKETNEDKKHTQLVEAKYIGNVVNRDVQTNSIFEDIDNFLEEGLTPDEIVSQGAKFAHYAASIERRYSAMKKANIELMRDVKVFYHCGDSGTGKTYSYKNLVDQLGKEQIYFISGGSYEHPFDGYLYEPILWLDELRSSSLSYNYLLNLLDKYPCDLECRYANKKAAWNEIHISTIIPLEDLYFSIKGKDDVSEASRQKNRDSIDQLKRRINYFVYHYIDPFKSGEERYQQFEILSESYTNFETLKIIEKEYLKRSKLQAEGQQYKLPFDDFKTASKSDIESWINELENEANLPF